MSYTGTVYCGYCGNRGHNKLGCPKRKEEARNNPDSYVAHALKSEAAIRRAAVDSRRCTYCRGKGHNRRGCKLKKFDMEESMVRTHAYRRKLVDKMKEVGLGVGSIVKVPHDPDRPHSVINYMITKINWDCISHRMMGVKSETGINSDNHIRWSHTESNILAARLVSHNIEEEFQRAHHSNYQPGHTTRLSLTRFAFEGLHPRPEQVYWNYTTVHDLDVWRTSTVGPISPDKVASRVPEDFYTASLPPSVLDMLGFDEGDRIVQYPNPHSEDL